MEGRVAELCLSLWPIIHHYKHQQRKKVNDTRFLWWGDYMQQLLEVEKQKLKIAKEKLEIKKRRHAIDEERLALDQQKFPLEHQRHQLYLAKYGVTFSVTNQKQ